MAINGATGPANAGGGISQAQVDAVLSAIDRSFVEVLRARFGGGIDSVMLQGSQVQEQRLRAAPAGVPATLLVELRLLERTEAGESRGPSGFGQLFHGLSTIIGHVTMTPLPGGSGMEATVVTEVFDDQDSASQLSHATLPTGVLLREMPPYLPGATGGNRIDVVRSQAGQVGSALSNRQAQRGWQPQPGRTRTNRGGGLGSNGRAAAPPTALPCPVAALLLRRLGTALTADAAIGANLDRVTLGLENGDAG